MNITAAVYIRKSREDSDKEAHRLTVQREQLPAYAVSKGWKPVIYDDGYASASRGNLVNLKERARMEADIRAGKIQIVLVLEFQRISRDDSMEDYARFIGLCRDHGVRLATPSQMIDPAQSNEWLLSILTGTLSAAEMQELKRRMAEGRAEAKRKGKFPGGVCPPPYVYDKATRRPVIDSASLERMQRVWELAETHSAKMVSETLNLPLITVRRMIDDYRLLFYQAKRLDEETGELIECDWEPCMTAEQAARIAAARKVRSNLKKGKRTAGALLSNMELIYCGYCGKTVKTWNNSRVRKDGSRLDYYGCQTKDRDKACPKARLISQQVLDRAVITNIFNTLSRLEDLKRAWDTEQKTQTPDFAAIDNAIRNTETKKSRLITAITDGIVSPTEAKQKMSELNAALAELQLKRDAAQNLIKAPPDWQAINISLNAYDRMTFEQRRRLVRLVIDRIDIYNAHALLHYRFPRKPGEYTAKINLPAPQQGKRIS